MATIDDVSRLLADDHGLSVVSTVRAPGRVLSSVVNCGIHPHPGTGESCVAFVSGGDAARLRHIRAGSEVTVTVRRSWVWLGVSGPATILGPDDGELGAEDVRLLLRSVFQAAGGSHEDYGEFDRVMANERRAAVFVSPVRILGNA